MSAIPRSLTPLRMLRKTLSPDELAFVSLYCGLVADHPDCRLDHIASARTAGFTDPGVTGWKLLRRRNVALAIDKRMAGRVAGPREVLGEISRLATQPDHVVTREIKEDGTVIETETKVDMRVKAKMLELLGRRYGHTQTPLERRLGEMLGSELERMRRDDVEAERARLLGITATYQAQVQAIRGAQPHQARHPKALVSSAPVDIEAEVVTGPRATPPIAVLDESPAPWDLPKPPVPRPPRRKRTPQD